MESGNSGRREQGTNADLQPTNVQFIRQHLNNTTLQTGATHRHLHTKTQKKRTS